MMLHERRSHAHFTVNVRANIAIRKREKATVVWILLCLFSATTYGAELYRWTDEKGRIHYGDSVPDSYKSNAKAIELPHAKATEAQRQEAEERLAKDKSRLDQNPKASGVSPAIPATRPGNVPFGNSDASCAEQWRKFDESWACFNPYRLANGGVKAEAYEHCTQVKTPNCVLPVAR